MLSSRSYNTDYGVGDLIIVLHSIEYMGFYVHSGELGLVVTVYDSKCTTLGVFDCRIKLKCGHELDVWYGEIHWREYVHMELCISNLYDKILGRLLQADSSLYRGTDKRYVGKVSAYTRGNQ